jgi:radical SAM superfamily enzyme YgiQ (UPF0313 family)
MQVCLVSAPTVAEFGTLQPLEQEVVRRYPLGVLSLAGTVEQAGIRPDVVDLDTLYAAWVTRSHGRGDFAQHAADRLARRPAPVYGLSSLCSSYPLTLRIATALRAARPGCRIVLGGPQATAAAEETLQAFPAVDAIVRGEGEPILPALLDALASGRDLGSVLGLTYRSRGGIARTGDAPLVADVDSLPLPAFHLYPGMRRAWVLPLEVGRGCPFSCTFCSTSRFFGRRFRMKSPARIVRDMLALRGAYGTRRFELIHDNFTVDRRRVEAFCEALSAARARFSWTCSSRTDSLDDDLLDRMWRAGCRGLFFGVESGSAEIQRAVNKRLDLAGARDRLRHVSRRKITSTLSFITGFPQETQEDLRKTVSFFVDSLRLDHLEPQITLLSPLTGTPMHERHRDGLILDDIVSDMSFQGKEQDRADRKLIGAHPAIFSSFYSVPTRWLDRSELDELRDFLLNARFELRWLLVAAAQVAGDGVSAFAAFRAWRAGEGSPPARAPAAYYSSRAFRMEFARFVGEELAARHPSSAAALRALARHYRGVLRTPRLARSARRRGFPVVGARIRLTRIPCDGAAIIQALRRGSDLSLVPRQPSALVTRITRERHAMLRIGEEAAALLALCDGTRHPRAIVHAFRKRYQEVHGVPGEAVAAFGLAALRRRGFLTVT